MLLADTFGKIVSWGYGLESFAELSAVSTLILILSYTMQIYFDFSGYCDMAFGVAKLYNISLPINFNSPYRATSIIDFWGRWHITLTRFLRKYVYFPLGGSKKGRLRTYINIMVVFLMSGLWHGANWTFVFWGALHGLAQIFNRIFKKVYDKVWKPIRWLLTFVIVNILWVFFHAESITQAMELLQRILIGKWTSISQEILEKFRWIEYEKVIAKLPGIEMLHARIPGLFLGGLLIGSFIIIFKEKNYLEREFKPSVWTALITILLVCWSILSFGGVSQFLYFNF